MGTGTRDMIRRCREAGLPEPKFSQKDGFVVVLRRYTDSIGNLHEVSGEVAEEVTEISKPAVDEVAEEVMKLLLVCRKEMSGRELREALQLKGDESFRRAYLFPALKSGVLEMTLPDKPNSRLQKYRITDKGGSVSQSA